MATINKWVFVNETKANTVNGSPLTDAELSIIANAVQVQLNRDYMPECGGLPTAIRVASNNTDILVGEKIYSFVDTFTNIPGASAYHDIEGKGVEAAYCAIGTCQDVFGPEGVSVDASHELLEDAGNPGCNLACDDNEGTMHERERCDAVEVQTYSIVIGSQQVCVSNFLLDSWQVPGAPPPYTFMTKNGLGVGGVDPSGPMQTAMSPGGNGNYQIQFPSMMGKEEQIFGKGVTGHVRPWLVGNPRKLMKVLHPSSRTQRILKRHYAKHGI